MGGDGMLPTDLIKATEGQTLFQEDGSMVWPLAEFSESQIVAAFRRLIEKHENAYRSEKTLAQVNTD